MFPVGQGFGGDGCHAFVQRLQIESISLTVCPAFGQLFSEKFLGDAVVRSYCVNFDVEPELGALRLDGVHIGSMNRTYTARGRLSIWLFDPGSVWLALLWW